IARRRVRGKFSSETRRQKWRSDIRSRRSEVRGHIFPGRSYFLRSIKICQRFVLSSFRMPCSSQAAYTEATASQGGQRSEVSRQAIIYFLRVYAISMVFASWPPRSSYHSKV